MLTGPARLVAVVAALAAVAATGCRKPEFLGGCKPTRLAVDGVRASGAKPDLHLRARFTDEDGKAIEGAPVQFLLKRSADENELRLDSVEDSTDSDGIADVDYGERMRGSDLIRQQAADVHVLHAYVDTTLSTLSEFCDTEADSTFEYRP